MVMQLVLQILLGLELRLGGLEHVAVHVRVQEGAYAMMEVLLVRRELVLDLLQALRELLHLRHSRGGCGRHSRLMVAEEVHGPCRLAGSPRCAPREPWSP